MDNGRRNRGKRSGELDQTTSGRPKSKCTINATKVVPDDVDTDDGYHQLVFTGHGLKQLVLFTEKRRQETFLAAHTASHKSLQNTFTDIFKKYYWNGIEDWVTNKVKTCPGCLERYGAEEMMSQRISITQLKKDFLLPSAERTESHPASKKKSANAISPKLKTGGETSITATSESMNKIEIKKEPLADEGMPDQVTPPPFIKSEKDLLPPEEVLSDDEKCYNVVLFTRSNTVRVCHESWIQLGEDEETFCYWPAHDPTEKALKKIWPVRDGISWKMYRVKLLKENKSWVSAHKFCKDTENKPNTDTSSSEVDAGKRKRKLPQRFREDETISVGAVKMAKVANRAVSKQQPMIIPASRIILLPGDNQGQSFLSRQSSHHDADKRANAADNGNASEELGFATGDSAISLSHNGSDGESFSSVSEVASTSALTLPLDSSSPIGSLWKKDDNVQSPDTDSPTGVGDDHSIENNYRQIAQCASITSMNRHDIDAVSRLRSEVLRLFMENQRNYDQFRDEMRKEIRDLKRYLEDKHNGKSEIVEDLLPSPCQTKEELLMLNSRLSKDKEARSRLVDALSKVGGRKVAESARWMLRKIATNGVLEKYRLTGTNETDNFEELQIYHCILRAIVKAYPCKEAASSCRAVVSDVLVQAKYHKGGTSFEVKKNVNPKKTCKVMTQNTRTRLSSDEDD